MDRTISGHKGQRIAGTVGVPGDKSITHRGLILGSLARGTTYVKNVPDGDDIQSTISALQQLGVHCERVGDAVAVTGLGQGRYRHPGEPVDCGGSATTMRLLLGAVAGRGQGATFVGDESLSRRPMDRIVKPLRLMGARIDATGETGCCPITIHPGDPLEPISYALDVASAQVKSALILAGLSVARGRTVLSGLVNSRDHTERLIPKMGGSVVVTDASIVVERCDLEAIALTVPGDSSTAAFMLAAAALLKNSQLTVKGVSTNPTRYGFFEALSWMGGDLSVAETGGEEREPYGDITVKQAPLRGIEVHREAIPFLVDEVPLVMLLATQAQGDTVLRGTSELRLKESDRIGCAVEGLTRMGAAIEVTGDRVLVRGNTPLSGADLDPWGDHRMSMMFTVAALAARGDSVIRNVDCEAKSCPHFFETLSALLR